MIRNSYSLIRRNIYYCCLIVGFIIYGGGREACAQDSFTLEEIIALAQGQSLRKKGVKNTFENNFWRYNSFKKGFLPSLQLDGSLPNLNVGVNEVLQPDGTSAFINRSQINSNLILSLNQNIGLTGGRLFASTELARLDLTGDIKSTSFRSSPIYLGLSQPVYRFNAFKWSKRVEPLVYEEAQRKSVEETEQVSMEAVNRFFDVLAKKADYEVAELNRVNSDTLYKIATGRYGLGKIAESELLQIELTLLTAQKSLAQSELDLQISLQELKTFLNLPPSEKLELEIDTVLPLRNVAVERVVELAKAHRSEFVAYQRRVIESERDLERVKRNNSFNLDMFIAVGLSQTATDLEGAYQNPLSQETVRVGLNVPLFNWGLNRSNIKQQRANTELVQIQVEQDQINFERQLFIFANQFNILSKQVEIAEKSREVAKKRYEVTKRRYLMGKADVDILTFNNSLRERNQAIRDYYATINSYWTSFYRLRQLTHYDFVRNEPLQSMVMEK